MYVQFCEHCGKRFITKSKLKKYCTKECVQRVAEIKKEKSGQPCYVCKNACGGCAWSRSFIPVKGWDATPTTIKDSEGDFSSYKIHKCPEFIRG